MSGVGNDLTFGNQKSNYHFQYSLLQATGQNTTLLQQIVSLLGGATGGDYELRGVNYKANKAGVGYSNGDFIVRTDVFDVSTNPATYKSTFWFNETTALNIATAPPIADLDPYTPPANVVATQSGTWNIATLTSGNTGGFTAVVSSTVVMSVAGAYATGDYMGTTTTPQSFSNAVRTSGGTGIIKSLFISDKINTTNVAMELWLFSATFTAPTDNAAWAISDGEALTVLGVIPILTSGWYASSNNQIYSDNTLSIPIKPAATSLFYALVARGTTPAFTSQDLTINLGILQD